MKVMSRTRQIKIKAKGRTTIDYTKISNTEIRRLLIEKVPDKKVSEVGDHNRQTMIAFLKVFSKEAR